MPGLELLQAAFFLLLFLAGLHWMSRALARTAGPSTKKLLSRAAGNPWCGFGTGFLATALLQSSSLTTVMVVGLINARVMTMAQGCGVIIGANVGTTITGQLLSFDLHRLAWPFLGLALLMRLLPRVKGNIRRAAAPLAGLRSTCFVWVGSRAASLSALFLWQNLYFWRRNPGRTCFLGAGRTEKLHSSA